MNTRVRLGALLAGGRGLRLGGVDKGGLILSGGLLAARAATRLSPQVSNMIVVGAKCPDWFAETGADAFVEDVQVDGALIGPAGGLLAALRFAVERYGKDIDVLTVPIDCPFFPLDIGDQLVSGRGGAPAAVARNSNGLQPVFGLWRSDLAGTLRRLVINGHMRALQKIAAETGAALVQIDAPTEAFHNINTADDLDRARRLISAEQQG